MKGFVVLVSLGVVGGRFHGGQRSHRPAFPFPTNGHPSLPSANTGNPTFGGAGQKLSGGLGRQTNPTWPFVGAPAPASGGESGPSVRTGLGTLVGLAKPNDTAAFLGIPFAQPPVGPLRFKPPQLIRQPYGTLLATKRPNKCMQKSMGPPPGGAGGPPGAGGVPPGGVPPGGPPPGGVAPGAAGGPATGGFPPQSLPGGPTGPVADTAGPAGGPPGGGGQGPADGDLAVSEDCLYLSVQTPEPRRGPNLPVLFFIHGGGFQMGSGSSMDVDGAAKNLVARGIVLVQPQYRLGAFGFLTSGDSNAPLNNALADQVAALRWVRDNIANFGGDPRRVTIAGQSAGAMAASLLSISPPAQGLFSQVAAMSGTYYVPDAMESNENADRVRPNSRRLAQLAGCGALAAGNPANGATVRCLQNVPAQTLQTLNDQQVGGMDDYGECCPWNPGVDGPGGFIPYKAADQRSPRPRNVPLMVGTAKDELVFQYLMALEMGKMVASDFNATLFEATLSRYQAPDFQFGGESELVRQLFRWLYQPKPQEANDPMAWFNVRLYSLGTHEGSVRSQEH